MKNNPTSELKQLAETIARLRAEKIEIEQRLSDAHHRQATIEQGQRLSKKLTPVMIAVLRKMSENKQVIKRSTYQDSYYMASADGNWAASINAATYYALRDREVITPASRENQNTSTITVRGRKSLEGATNA